MEENEAIELLNVSYIVDRAGDVDQRRIKLKKFLISALKEIQKYRKNGTVEECRQEIYQEERE